MFRYYRTLGELKNEVDSSINQLVLGLCALNLVGGFCLVL